MNGQPMNGCVSASAPREPSTITGTVHETLCKALNNASHLTHIRDNLDGILNGDAPCESTRSNEPSLEGNGLVNLVYELLEVINVTADSLQELDNVIRSRIG